MELTELEAKRMSEFIRHAGCRCTDEQREVYWRDTPGGITAFRHMLCKCGAAYAVPVFMIRMQEI